MRKTKVKRLRAIFLEAIKAETNRLANETQKINRRRVTIKIPGHARYGKTFETHTNYNPVRSAWRSLKKAHA